MPKASCMFAILCCLTYVAFAQQTAPPLSIFTESLPQPLLHQQYEFRLQARGGIPPLHWKISRGELPEGITLDDSSGVISGVAKEVGEREITISVVDSVGNSVSRDFRIKALAPLLIGWSHYPVVQGNQINGSVKVSNGTRDQYDLTVIILAVNEYGKAFALGYQRLDLKPETTDIEIPFGSTLPQGAYVVHADAVAEIAAKDTIYRARQQTPKPMQITTGP